MFKLFFILFLLVPAIELYVLIQVGGEIGALTTILLVLLTAFVGAYLMKSQGLNTMQRAQQNLMMGQVPQTEMLEGVFIFMGGLLLLIPGFITDALGFLFLIPPVRQWLANNAIKTQQSQFARHYRHSESNVYEAEWYEQTPEGKVAGQITIIDPEETPSEDKKDKGMNQEPHK